MSLAFALLKKGTRVLYLRLIKIQFYAAYSRRFNNCKFFHACLTVRYSGYFRIKILDYIKMYVIESYNLFH